MQILQEQYICPCEDERKYFLGTRSLRQLTRHITGQFFQSKLKFIKQKRHEFPTRKTAALSFQSSLNKSQGKMMQDNVTRSIFFIALLASASVNAWGGGTIYKCKNHEGALIYQKSPCSQNTDTICSSPLKISKPNISESEENKNAKNQPSP